VPKAALWSVVAAAAQLGSVALGALAYPYLLDLLTAVGYGFLLPPIAVLHVRHAAVRRSGAVLTTLAGGTVAAVGLAGGGNVDVVPAGLFALGMWWWTSGKLWAQTGVLPAALGRITAALGLAAFAAVPLSAFGPAFAAVLPRALADALALPYAALAHLALGLWLVGLAIALLRGGRAT
jgi:hypothetical protein